jgi:Na+-transporting NADH:ubiquinone oxidoreductase subunit NqrB
VFVKLKNPFYKKLALAIFVFQLIHIGRQLVTDPTMLPYFWFFSGFIYLLPNLESLEMQKAETD